MKIKKARTLISDNTRPLFWFFIGVTVLSLVFYIYLVNQTVRNVVTREDMESRLALRHSNISQLESQYFAYTNKLDLNLAKSLGFNSVAKALFVSRQSVSALTLNTGAR